MQGRTVQLNGKWDLWLPEHRAARSQWESGWEVARLDDMADKIISGMVVYDIGAEEGDITALCAKWVGPYGGVMPIEPNPLAWPIIRAIWHGNDLPPPLDYFAGFASDTTWLRPPRLDFDPSPRGAWPACACGPIISDHGFRSLAKSRDCTPQIRIDDMITYGTQPPHVVTMDVEGAELCVLDGMRRILAQYRPRVWISVHPEFMSRDYGHTADDLHAFMISHGYRATHLAMDHEEHWRFDPT